MILDPSPAYVVKTVDVESGEKVFINVCTDAQIAAPATLDAGEIAVRVTRGEDWVVPIVVSAGRRENDKAGQPCFAADCCMHPSVVLLGIEDPSVKVLTVETCIELVEDRFGRTLSRDYRFPRLKSKGQLARTTVDAQQPQQQQQQQQQPLNELVQPARAEVQPQEQSQTPPSVEVVGSSAGESPFYLHVYRGKYAGSGARPSHVVELAGEHHDVRLTAQTLRLGEHSLELPFAPQAVDAFYNSQDETTYIMLWKHA